MINKIHWQQMGISVLLLLFYASCRASTPDVTPTATKTPTAIATSTVTPILTEVLSTPSPTLSGSTAIKAWPVEGSDYGILDSNSIIPDPPQNSWIPCCAPLSPDGRKVAYLVVQSLSHGISLKNLDNGEVSEIFNIRLSNGEAFLVHPVWSLDSRAFAFEANDGTLYIADAESHQLTSLGQGKNPAWSPVGSQLVYVSWIDGKQQLFLTDSQGGNTFRLVDEEAELTNPAWSPNGQQIAFVLERGGNHNIYVINVDGTDLRRLTNSEGNDNFPAWSPDGTRIAFVSNRSGQGEVHVMNARGSDRSTLTRGGRYASFPVWSPDGAHIAFISDLDDHDAIYIIRDNGSELQRIANTGIFNPPAWLIQTP